MKVGFIMNAEFQPPMRTGLLDFLKNSTGSQFVIPVYQRNYTWTAGKEVKQFLDDLKSVLDGEYPNHFLGIIIYLDTPIDFSSREFSVIDGQQRLTTLFLFLYAARSLMSEKGDENGINSLDGQYLTNPYVPNENLKYKLKPQVNDDNVYQYIVTGNEEKIEETESKIYKNYKYIQKHVKELNEEYTLNEILLALNKLYIVCIPLSENDNAQKIFESINATGVKLTASDLIRNFLLMDIDSETQERYYEEYWLELENLLTRDSKKLEAFFRFYLAVKSYNLPNKSAVYDEFVNWYKDEVEELGVEGIFKDVVKYAEFYNEIYYKELEQINPGIVGAIGEFRRILSDMPAPLLMGFYHLYSQELITPKQLSDLIFVINNYLIRRTLCDIDTSSITRMFAPLLKNVLSDCDGDYTNIVEILKRNLVFKNINNSMYTPDNQQLTDAVMNANMYNLKSTLRIFFDKLEHYKNPAPVDLSELSIEHLMPQTPSEEWIDELNVTEDEYQRNINRLGNLTLATKVDNSRMQNRVWKYKNQILSDTSHLTINQKILEKEKWGLEEIEERTKDLISEINKLFPYPETSEHAIRKEEVFINSNNINASGYLYLDNGDVEIMEGSELYMYHNNFENFPDIEDERKELIDEGIIFDNGKELIFKKSHMVNSKYRGTTALSPAASLVLHGSRNGWYYWKDSEGKSLSENEEISKMFN